MKKALSIFLCIVIFISLAACGTNGGNTNTATQGSPVAQNPADTTQPDTNTATSPSAVTVDKVVDPSSGTELAVDISTRGEIKSNAPALNSGEFILEGTTMHLPFDGSVLANSGWVFSENSTAKDTVIDPNSTTNLISFYIYDPDGNEMMLLQAVNNSDSAKPVLDCQISEFQLSTLSINEAFGDLILPGGICILSKAADVIAVFGAPENNSNFERVEVFEHGIRYVENKQSGLCYYFGFYSSEDYNGELNGHIRTVTISTEY